MNPASYATVCGKRKNSGPTAARSVTRQVLGIKIAIGICRSTFL